MTKKGFTLLEMLLVISLITTTIWLTFPLYFEALEEVATHLFLKEFQMKLRMIQNQALITGKTTKMTLNFTEQEILFEGYYLAQKKEVLKIPTQVTGEGTIVFQFKGGTGTYGKFQRITFISQRNQHHFIFQIGSGRYRYEKESL
ncbi:competence type IV pilus minor pilin ComGD [Isobaculum melis]|uniref:Competence protein ComGD n=1 Tax=Isobaculum melis TaxID=142588 RepID=A0A1H9TWZ1_9LACT|nr:competence type IV pilus minor pilin ComGD [Isobaculum melis]SES01427.1 competence protein ComGD [Isobaculum melis]